MSAWLDAGWPAPPGVRALTTLRHGLGVSQVPFDAFNLGARCGDDPRAVLENRRQLATALQLPSAPRWLRQVHGVEVARFDASAPSLSLQSKGRVGEGCPATIQTRETPSQPPTLLHEKGGDTDEPVADASVTTTLGTVLAILTADCLPVVLAARDGSELAVAHAGWRGLADGVLEATVATMSTPPAHAQAWLGPCAGAQAYEVGQDVFDAFVSRDVRAADCFVATRPGHWKVDLYALARQRLADADIATEHIHGGGLCTISDPSRFFSHRRDQRTGRMATLVWRDSL